MPETFEITVHRGFTATHAIRLPDGSREPVNGHDWEVRVTVACRSLDRMQAVMDFHELETIVDGVIAPWRDRHLDDVPPFNDGKINSTAERVAWWIGREVAKRIRPEAWVSSVAVTEAPGCIATYRPPRPQRRDMD